MSDTGPQVSYPQKVATLIQVEGIKLAVIEDKQYGRWSQRGTRCQLHWYTKTEKGITATNPIAPEDLEGQPKLLASLKDHHGITPA